MPILLLRCSRTVVDRLTGQDVQLVDGDLDLVHRLIKAQVPSAQYDLYQPFLDLYSHEVMETPLSGRPEHKRSFLPSKVTLLIRSILNEVLMKYNFHY